MNEERQMILQMLRDGQITVEDSEKLLDALNGGAEPGTQLTARTVKPKRLIIDASEYGKETINIKIPFSLVKLGLKLGGKFSVGQTITADGRNSLQYLEDIDFDEILAELAAGEIELPYTLVEVDDPNTASHIRVVIE